MLFDPVSRTWLISTTGSSYVLCLEDDDVLAQLYAPDGFGGAARRWHAHTLRHVLPRGDRASAVIRLRKAI